MLVQISNKDDKIYSKITDTWKGQCHEIFYTYFCLQFRPEPPPPHINRQKRFRKLFCFCEGIRLQRSKIACPRCICHLFVVDYADTAKFYFYVFIFFNFNLIYGVSA